MRTSVPNTLATSVPARPATLLLAGLGALLPFSGSAFAHGYVEYSRNKLCAEGLNSDCGAIIYEPQSVEGPDRFPTTGPEDGTIAAAGSAAWAPLNEQSPTRWTKAPITAGRNTFHWFFTANHVSRDYRYFITRPDWNPSAPLSRAQFENGPFCVHDGGFVKPAIDTYHTCNVPARQGYHVILAVWDVGDTTASFYNAIDVEFTQSTSVFDGDGGELAGGGTPDTGAPGGTPGTPGTGEPGYGGEDVGGGSDGSDEFVRVGTFSGSINLAAGDAVRLRLFSEEGELAGRAIDFAITDGSRGNADTWPIEFARYINAQSFEVRAGNLANASDGTIDYVGIGNNVFARPSSGIVRTELELVVAEPPTVPDTPAEPTEPTPGTTPPIASDAPPYPSGKGGYAAGDRVTGSDGNVYECDIAGWCNNPSELYYAPGSGLAWDEAWNRV